MTNPFSHHFRIRPYAEVHAQIGTEGLRNPIIRVEAHVESWIQDRVQWRVRMMLWHHGVGWTQADATRRVSGSATRLDHITAAQ